MVLHLTAMVAKEVSTLLEILALRQILERFFDDNGALINMVEVSTLLEILALSPPLVGGRREWLLFQPFLRF